MAAALEGRSAVPSFVSSVMASSRFERMSPLEWAPENEIVRWAPRRVRSGMGSPDQTPSTPAAWKQHPSPPASGGKFEYLRESSR